MKKPSATFAPEEPSPAGQAPTSGGVVTETPRAAVAIGNFDGVHEGHRTVLAAARAAAAELGLVPTVLTFFPHPIEVLRRGSVPLLTTLDERIARLSAEGFRVHVEPFTAELSEESPESFAERILVQRLHAGLVLVGEDFRFGRGRVGDLRLLTELGGKHGFEARAVELSEIDAEPVSSSRIRRALSEGHIELARKLLGRSPAFTGLVEIGDQRGRTLGFPTANLKDVPVLLPKDGVYAGFASIETDSGLYPLGGCVMNLGGRPTVGRPRSLEVHILDFAGDLYGKTLRIELLARLRDVVKFSSLDALVDQIKNDVDAARRVVSAPAAGA